MSMAVEMARDTVRQRLWARDRLMSAARGVEASRLTEEMGMGQGTLLRTIEHLMLADEVWVAALEGDADVVLEQDAYADLAAIGAAWPAVDARWLACAGALTEARLGGTVRRTSRLMNTSYEVRVCDVLMHVSTHAMYTLAQAANMVRRLGGEAPQTGYSLWAVEGKAQPGAVSSRLW